MGGRVGSTKGEMVGLDEGREGGHIMKCLDATEHIALKDNFVGHRMVLVTNNMFGKSSNENYQTNQCKAIIQKSVPWITQCIIWCYAWDSRLTLNTLEKEHLVKKMLQLFLRHGTTTICLQSLVVYEKGGVMPGTQHYRHKTSTVYWVTVI